MPFFLWKTKKQEQLEEQVQTVDSILAIIKVLELTPRPDLMKVCEKQLEKLIEKL